LEWLPNLRISSKKCTTQGCWLREETLFDKLLELVVVHREDYCFLNYLFHLSLLRSNKLKLYFKNDVYSSDIQERKAERNL
jgi:hypothetical protein